MPESDALPPNAALAIYASTEPGGALYSADLFWRTKFRAHDPVLYAEYGSKNVLFASSLEFGRARKEAKVDRVLLLDDIFRNTQERSYASALGYVLKKEGIKAIAISSAFPYGVGRKLEEMFSVEVREESLFRERAVKTAEEIAAIRAAGDAVQEAFEDVRAMLKESTVQGDALYRAGAPLTSESLRAHIERELYMRGYLARNTIVACGGAAADPHAQGAGPIAPGMPIVIDVFPQSLATHYFVDVTRTLFKTEPHTDILRMYEAVREAQEHAVAAVRAGRDAAELHRLVEQEFEQKGYATRIADARAEGFIHSLGHGVGLEVHEDPYVGSGSRVLDEGNVITIEPGLYYPQEYPGIPAVGIRIEDTLAVRPNGSEALHDIPKDLGWAVVP